MHWLKDNWFKVATILLALFAIISLKTYQEKEFNHALKLEVFKSCLGDSRDNNGNPIIASGVKVIANTCKSMIADF
jgi:hypothetical protein